MHWANLNDPNIFVSDDFTEVQFSLAVEFYNSVKSANPGKDITLTGHSLGGALAGYVATLFREDAQLADHIDFEGPLQAFVHNWAIPVLPAPPLTILQTHPFNPLFGCPMCSGNEIV